MLEPAIVSNSTSVWDTSPKSIDHEGLEESRTGTRKTETHSRVWYITNRPNPTPSPKASLPQANSKKKSVEIGAKKTRCVTL